MLAFARLNRLLILGWHAIFWSADMLAIAQLKWLHILRVRSRVLGPAIGKAPVDFQGHLPLLLTFATKMSPNDPWPRSFGVPFASRTRAVFGQISEVSAFMKSRRKQLEIVHWGMAKCIAFSIFQSLISGRKIMHPDCFQCHRILLWGPYIFYKKISKIQKVTKKSKINFQKILKFSKPNNSKRNKAPWLLSISRNSAHCEDIFFQKFPKFKNWR